MTRPSAEPRPPSRDAFHDDVARKAVGQAIRPDLDAFISSLDIAVLLPCRDEAQTIGAVVEQFRSALPGAHIYVYDNRSTDRTAQAAVHAGATVRSEPSPGKGNVVRRMFADIDADLYVMADGDGTYDASRAPGMIRRLVGERLDMVVGTRRNLFIDAGRPNHALGNWLFNRFYRGLFGSMFTDIFSGYRVFSRRYVKSFPAISAGFEIEAEMSVQASQLRMPTGEVETDYGSREVGSSSKLDTFRDAVRILRMQVRLFKEIRPARFFGLAAVLLIVAAVAISLPLLPVYLATGLVRRFPTAILSTGLVLLAALLGMAGLILDSVAAGRLEIKRLAYLDQAHLRRGSWPDGKE